MLAAAELFGRAPTHGRRRLQRAAKFGTHRAQIDFSELNEGELVVHLEHGIGRFLGLQRMGGPETGEVLAIEFAEEAKLYVPLEQAFMVSRYVGVGKKSPPLSSLADAKWTRAKKNAVASIFDYAGKMLALQAERETQRGHAFGPDTKWQLEFEHSFPFRETPDQLEGDRRNEARHGGTALDGSPDLRRRRLRQNRGRDSRRLQGGDGRQTGRRPHPDDRARAAAFRNVSPANARLSGANRNAEPVPLAGGTAQGARSNCARAASMSSSARIG